MKLEIKIKEVKEEPPILTRFFEVKFNREEPENLLDEFEVLTAIGNELGIEILNIIYKLKL